LKTKSAGIASTIRLAVDRVKWKLDRKRRWVADLRREAAERQLEAVRRHEELRTAIERGLDSVRRSTSEMAVAIGADVDSLRRSTEDRLAELAGAIGADLDSLRRSTDDRLSESRGAIGAELDALRRSTEESKRHAEAGRRDIVRQIGVLEHITSSALAPKLASRTGDQGRGKGAPEVSIIMAVYNRLISTAEAIESVLAQTFQAWELIVVDDGSDEDLESVVKPYLADRRIRFIRQTRQGAAAARNAGLRQAKGAMIAYLDSDNLWYPGYLSEAVAALKANPQIDVAYGVLVTEAHGLGERCFLFQPFDRERLLDGSYIDLNVMAHRSSLVADAGGFDESLDRLMDWDLVLRYTRNRAALGIPVLAARYRTLDSLRITDNAPLAPNWLAIRKKGYPPEALETRLRVLYVVWHYPQLSETYVETELQCMRRWGVHVEVWSSDSAASLYPSRVPIHTGPIEDAVRDVRPDLIHVHWLNFALSVEAALVSSAAPVTVRLHGFEVTREGLETLLSKPWVKGVYAFPPQVALLNREEPRLKAVPAAFDSSLFHPNRKKDRRLVVRAGAAIPSKDVKFLFEIAKMLPQFRFVYAGVTAKNLEHYPAELMDLRSRMESPVEIMLDLPRGEVADLIGRSGIYLHTISPEGDAHFAPVGMPVSIAEAMATGAYVLARNAPELAAYLSDGGRTYCDLNDAAKIIAETASWTDEDWKRIQDRAVAVAYAHYADELVFRTIFEDWVRIVRAVRGEERLRNESVSV
jgi:glycosyltransferase involved in cell wall biosynthesis